MMFISAGVERLIDSNRSFPFLGKTHSFYRISRKRSFSRLFSFITNTLIRNDYESWTMLPTRFDRIHNDGVIDGR
jgi:hypothetical protein